MSEFIDTEITISSDAFRGHVVIHTVNGDQSEALAMMAMLSERAHQFERGYDHEHDDASGTSDDLARDAVLRISKLWMIATTPQDREELMKQGAALMIAALAKHYREVGE